MGRQRGHAHLPRGPKNRRFCLPHTRFLIHQPSGGAGGQATDIAIQAREILKARERIAEVISRETGQPIFAMVFPYEEAPLLHSAFRGKWELVRTIQPIRIWRRVASSDGS